MPTTDLRVLSALDSDRPRSQRDIARAAKLSLGATNVALKRLLGAGHLTVEPLNRRKVRYVLTPKGIAERAQAAFLSAARTVQEFGLLKRAIQAEVLRVHKSGVVLFSIVGDNELADLAESALRDMRVPNLQYGRARRLGDIPAETQALLLTEPAARRDADGRVVLELPSVLLGASR